VVVFGCTAVRSARAAYMRSKLTARSERRVSSGSPRITDTDVDAKPVDAWRHTTSAGCIAGPAFWGERAACPYRTSGTSSPMTSTVSTSTK
jgi:hypothetical protein